MIGWRNEWMYIWTKDEGMNYDMLIDWIYYKAVNILNFWIKFDKNEYFIKYEMEKSFLFVIDFFSFFVGSWVFLVVEFIVFFFLLGFRMKV